MSLVRSDDLLAQLAAGFPRLVELSLRPDYFNLLHALGDPHERLPPVIHVAGTNGKGSTCAFLRAMLEAAGKTVHVYTSPHLVRFHERIRIVGRLIDEAALVPLLQDVARLIIPGSISQFEATTAAAFKAFADTPADFLILETGLGGRYDATNVVAQPLASIITRISYDHRDFLGETLVKIAGEKAGIIKTNSPCFIGQQMAPEVWSVFNAEAIAKTAPLRRFGRDWRIEPHANGFHFFDDYGTMNLPTPALLGAHQMANASLAVAALRYALPQTLPDRCFATGLRQADWPARLQRLTHGGLAGQLPAGWELWLDGGHNDSAGEVLAAQALTWQQDASPSKPLYVVYGMLKSKVPQEFLQPLAPYLAGLRAVAIPGEANASPAEMLLAAAQICRIKNAAISQSVSAALADLTAHNPPGRILICGSLYLAGHVLENVPRNSA